MSDRAGAGGAALVTKLGVIEIAPAEIAVIPGGLKSRSSWVEGPARGLYARNTAHKFTCPTAAPIGANCLAITRDSQDP